MNYYNRKMDKLKRIDFRKNIEINKPETSLIKVKRKSLIKLVDNRKSFDLSKWKDKKFLVVNRRYSSELNKKNTNNNKRIKSWHADSDFSPDISRTIRKRNISNLAPLNSINQDIDQTFDSSILTDCTTSLCSSRSSMEISNENDVLDDDSIIDMSYNIEFDSDNKHKVGFIKSFIYDILNKKYNEERNLDNDSYLKPFNLKRAGITQPNNL